MIAIVEAARAGLLKRGNILRNVIAGLVVAVIALPMSMAFAIASGAKPEAGIYTSIVAVIIVSLFGGTRVQITGPTSAFIGVLTGVVAEHGLGGLQIATVMAGIFMAILGILKCGKMIKFIPGQVVAGFTAGIGINMLASQIPNFFGLKCGNLPSSMYGKVVKLAEAFPTINLKTAYLGIITLTVILVVDRTKLKKIPSALWAIALGMLVQFLFKFGDIETIGSKFGGIPAMLPRFTPTSRLSFELIHSLIGPAFAIAMLGAIESLLCAVITDNLTGIKHDSNQELLAHGLANIASPLFGGIATTGSIARTIAGIRVGSNSPLAGIASAVILAAIVCILAPLMRYVPLVSLSAILFVVGYRMINVPHIISIIVHAPKCDAAVLILITLLTLFYDIVTAVAVGVVLSALILMYRMSNSGHIDRVEKTKHKEYDFSNTPDGVAVYEICGPMFFGMIDKISTVFSSIGTGDKIIIFRMFDVPFIDTTGLENLSATISTLKKFGKTVLLSESNNSVICKLKKSHLIDNFVIESAQKPIDDVIGLAVGMIGVNRHG